MMLKGNKRRGAENAETHGADVLFFLGWRSGKQEKALRFFAFSASLRLFERSQLS
jgi:hypothetical protein